MFLNQRYQKLPKNIKKYSQKYNILCKLLKRFNKIRQNEYQIILQPYQIMHRTPDQPHSGRYVVTTNVGLYMTTNKRTCAWPFASPGAPLREDGMVPQFLCFAHGFPMVLLWLSMISIGFPFLFQ